MRILHYLHGLPPVRGGGLVKYAIDLAKEQSKRHDVALLVPGAISYAKKARKKVSVTCGGKWNGIQKYLIQNPLPIPMGNGILDIDMYTYPCDVEVYKKFLTEYQPDVIHLHTLMGVHKEFLEAANCMEIPVVYTTHDYFGVCPIANLMCDKNVCTQPGKLCGECSRYAFSEKRLWLEQTSAYRIYRKSEWLIKLLRTGLFGRFMKSIRSVSPEKAAELEEAKGEEIQSHEEMRGKIPAENEYKRLFAYYHEMFHKVSYFHFNSEVCRQAFERGLGPLEGEVIHISNSGVSDKRTLHVSKGKLKIGFLGGDVAVKGLKRLQKIINELYLEGKTQIELQVYGSLERKDYPFCVYFEAYKENERDEVFRKMDLLAVPSSWLETFGMVVIEALSYGVPVLVTDKVGAKGILENSEKPLGIILPDEDSAWKTCLSDLYEHREKVEEYSANICQADLELDFPRHVERMIELYRQCAEW